jgi:proteic killer suppression protein
VVELAAAETLADMNALPSAHCHQLVGERKRQFAVAAGPKLRIVFEPADNPIPRTADKGIDLAKVTKIRVLSIEDYHEE